MTIVDQVLNALQNPSAEHMQIYAGLGVVVLVVAFIAYSALKGNKGDDELVFTLADSGVAEDPMEKDAKENEKFFKEIDANGPYETKTGG